MTRTSWWPDRRPLPRRRDTLVALLVAAAFVLGPWTARGLGADVPVELAAIWNAFGLGFGLQAVLDLLRPAPGDAVGTVLHRCVYVGMPFALCIGTVALISRP